MPKGTSDGAAKSDVILDGHLNRGRCSGGGADGRRMGWGGGHHDLEPLWGRGGCSVHRHYCCSACGEAATARRSGGRRASGLASPGSDGRTCGWMSRASANCGIIAGASLRASNRVGRGEEANLCNGKAGRQQLSHGGGRSRRGRECDTTMVPMAAAVSP